MGLGCCLCGCDYLAERRELPGGVAAVLCLMCRDEVIEIAMHRIEPGTVVFEVQREASARVDALASW